MVANLPSERIAVVVLANKGVGFTGGVVDALIAAILPRYAELRAQAASKGSAQSTAPTRAKLDSTFVGTWVGFIRAEDGNVPVELALTDSGSVRATVGLHSGERLGRARFDDPQFLVRIPGDLETPDAASGRRLSFYLRPRNGLLNGTVTTRPRVSSGLDGQLSYWVELKKRPALR